MTSPSAVLTAGSETRRVQLRSDVALAARVVPTHYPLETFIAVNPLAGLERMPFEQALQRAADLYGIGGTLGEPTFRGLHRDGRISDEDLDRALTQRYPNLADAPDLHLGRDVRPLELLRADLLYGIGGPPPKRRMLTRSERCGSQVIGTVDAQTSKWCAAFFGHAAWPMPGREDGFYAAWRALAPFDQTLPRAVRAGLRKTAARADDAALEALEQLGIDDDSRIPCLQAHLTRMPGWAAHVQWCAARNDAQIDLVQYLAMRLTYEALLLTREGRPQVDETDSGTQAYPSARDRAAHLVSVLGLSAVEADLNSAARLLTSLPVSAREGLWQNAFEAGYRDHLLSELTVSATVRQPPHTQLVSCIDTRSEGLRRHLESMEGYETLGFAGFFAVAIRFTDLLGGAPNDLCPVLITPSYDVRERPAPDAADAAARRLAGATSMAGAESAFHAAKDAFAAPFTLAEAAGFAAAPLSAAKTLAPALSTGIRRRLRDVIAPTAPTVLDLATMPAEDRILFAQVALTMMGLTSDFARTVVLCGHGSTTENNPYQASLDCGACGGQQGGPSARTAAAILNQPKVRAGLRDLGIEIPAETVFVPAQHDTATDRVVLFDEELIPADHRDDIARLRVDLERAGSLLAAERCAVLPGASPEPAPRQAARHVAGRSSDWAQVYPEWGLAGNAAFIVAPRDVTRGVDLQRRVFLHSYVADVDPDGSALETILTAPMVVAQWINCQYFFSAVAPERFGAGTKTIHNVVGGAGVIAGHSGDLLLGLPWQSVSDGNRLLHEPMRLLAVVQAPLSRIDMIIDRNPILQRLFGNDWVALAGRGHPDEEWQRWTQAGWRPWVPNPFGNTGDTTCTGKGARDEEMVP